MSPWGDTFTWHLAMTFLCRNSTSPALLTGRSRSRRLDQPIPGSPSAKPQKEAVWQSSTSTARSATCRSEADTPLLWVIREQVGLTGTKYGCGVAQCGACSVHINGEVVRSCSIPVGAREGHRPDRHHRGPVADQLASGAEGVGGARRAAVRLLPVGADHGGRGAAEEESEADRQGHRRGDDQHLPLRHLSAHPRGRAHGGRDEGGSRPQAVEA